MISVIVIAYNRKKYLKKAIDSLLKQTFKDFEIIVIKNFKDLTIDQFLEQNHITNFITDKIEIGAHYAEGIRLAKGNLVAFLDDDDYYDVTKLERVNEVFNRYTNLCFYCSNIIAINEVGDIIPYDRRMIPLGKKVELKNEVLLDENFSIERKLQILKYYEAFWAPSSFVIKKDAIISYLSKLEIMYNAPGIFIVSVLASSNCNFFIDNKKLTYYRFHISGSHIDTSNRLEYFKDKEIFYLNSFKSLNSITEILNEKSVLDFVSLFLSLTKFNCYIFAQNTVINKKEILKNLLTINKNKYLLRISELFAISIVFLFGLIMPRKGLRNLFYCIEKSVLHN